MDESLALLKREFSSQLESSKSMSEQFMKLINATPRTGKFESQDAMLLQSL
jgi:hypothetical protein